MRAWTLAFSATLMVEALIVLALVPGRERRDAFTASLMMNALTHPLAWLAVHQLGLGWWTTELSVTATEWLLFRTLTRLTWTRAAILAVAANSATMALSFAL